MQRLQRRLQLQWQLRCLMLRLQRRMLLLWLAVQLLQWLAGQTGLQLDVCADALAMTRSDSGSGRPLVLAVDTDAVLFNANQWNFDYEAGVRAYAGLTGPSGIQYQGVYMDIPRIGNSAVISSANNLRIPFPFGCRYH